VMCVTFVHLVLRVGHIDFGSQLLDFVRENAVRCASSSQDPCDALDRKAVNWHTKSRYRALNFIAKLFRMN